MNKGLNWQIDGNGLVPVWTGYCSQVLALTPFSPKRSHWASISLSQNTSQSSSHRLISLDIKDRRRKTAVLQTLIFQFFISFNDRNGKKEKWKRVRKFELQMEDEISNHSTFSLFRDFGRDWRKEMVDPQSMCDCCSKTPWAQCFWCRQTMNLYDDIYLLYDWQREKWTSQERWWINLQITRFIPFAAERILRGTDS